MCEETMDKYYDSIISTIIQIKLRSNKEYLIKQNICDFLQTNQELIILLTFH